ADIERGRREGFALEGRSINTDRAGGPTPSRGLAVKATCGEAGATPLESRLSRLGRALPGACWRSRAFECRAYRQSGTAEIDRRGQNVQPTLSGRARGRRGLRWRFPGDLPLRMERPALTRWMAVGAFRGARLKPTAAARGGGKNNARSTGVGGPAPPELRGCVYLARLNVTSAVPLPADGVRTVYFISSPATVIGRFCSVPFQFGNELYSM